MDLLDALGLHATKDLHAKSLSDSPGDQGVFHTVVVGDGDRLQAPPLRLGDDGARRHLQGTAGGKGRVDVKVRSGYHRGPRPESGDPVKPERAFQEGSLPSFPAITVLLRLGEWVPAL